MQLPELQQRFVNAALFDSCDALLSEVVGDTITATERLAAYKNNVYVGLFETLKNAYPTILTLVGEDFFRGIVHHYVKQQPPTMACLDAYGAGLADFLKEYEPAKSLAYLPDMARFDWAMHESSNAENDKPLPAKKLQSAGNAVADMPIPLRAHVRLLKTAFPCGIIWRLCQLPDNATPIKLSAALRHYVIYRADDYTVWFEEITAPVYAALECLVANGTFNGAVEAADAHDNHFDFEAFLVFLLSRESLKDTLC